MSEYHSNATRPSTSYASNCSEGGCSYSNLQSSSGQQHTQQGVCRRTCITHGQCTCK